MTVQIQDEVTAIGAEQIAPVRRFLEILIHSRDPDSGGIVKLGGT